MDQKQAEIPLERPLLGLMSIFRPFCILLILTSGLLGKDRLRLEEADVLESKTIDGKTVQYLSGNVIITKGDLTLTCQEGRNYEREEIAYLFRDVTATTGRRARMRRG